MGTSGKERQATRRAKLKAECRHQLLVTLSAESLRKLDDACKASQLKRDTMLERAIEMLETKKARGVPKNSEQALKPLEGREMVLCKDGVFRQI